jgi:hypothetical protein
VWSVAGHILGLGDRHCDNLLVDLASGANVQIDFGVLFDQGLSLPVPEIVPFRLTQNMVDSFGVCGVEGTFRISCSVGVPLQLLVLHTTFSKSVATRSIACWSGYHESEVRLFV